MPLFTMKMSDIDHARLKAAARERGLTMAGFVRSRIAAEVEQRVVVREARPDPVIAGLDDASREAARLIAIGPQDVAAQLAARGIPVPQIERPVSRVRSKEPIKMHRHQASGNGPVPVCTCGAVRSSDGFWHIVPD